ARVGLSRPAAVADGQPLRDRVARLGLGRPADRLCSVGRELRLLADEEALPPADAIADVDEGTLTAGRREQPLAPQLLLLLESIAEAGSDGITPEALYLAVWHGSDDYHALRHRNAVYVAVNRLRAALEPIAGKDALRSTATHYALAPGLRIAVCRAVRRLDLAGFRGRAGDGLDVHGYARRHRLPASQARWELALHAAEKS
ncbi:MAG: transcriptional regulator, family, partial [bacterium]|nr:transcriptional regulator, family [bacterium]